MPLQKLPANKIYMVLKFCEQIFIYSSFPFSFQATLKHRKLRRLEFLRIIIFNKS